LFKKTILILITLKLDFKFLNNHLRKPSEKCYKIQKLLTYLGILESSQESIIESRETNSDYFL